MSTTHKYGFNFIIPTAMTDTPIAFSMFHKGFDELDNDLGYYSYNEYMALPGNKAFYTPSGTHAMIGHNITSTKFRTDFEAMLFGSPFVIYDGEDVDNWEDLDQSMYIWIVSTEPNIPTYNFDAFKAVSPLFKEVVE